MLLDFTKRHWLSIYRCRFPAEAPDIEMRVMTGVRRASIVLGGDVPNYSGHAGRFLMKLLATRIAMGFQSATFDAGKRPVYGGQWLGAMSGGGLVTDEGGQNTVDAGHIGRGGVEHDGEGFRGTAHHAAGDRSAGAG